MPKIELEDDQKPTHLDFQFCVAVYLREEYLKDKTKTSNLYSDWGGIEFGNSWKSGVQHAKDIVKKNPEYLCVVIDKMNRKKPLEV